MAKYPQAEISGELLIWARETAHMTPEVAARKIGVPVKKLKSWEETTLNPTVRQLRVAAKVYQRPFVVFFLEKPPKDFNPIRDYRRLPGSEAGTALSSDLAFEIRGAHIRRQAALGMFEELEEAPPVFELRMSRTANIHKSAAEVRQHLGISVDTQTHWRNPHPAFNAWRAAVENLGVLVFQSIGIPVSEMRGFSLAMFPLPVITINRSDSYAGRTFSLLHELGHLLLRGDGLCDLHSNPRDQEGADTEVLCNSFAAEILVPSDVLLGNTLVTTHKGMEWSNEEVQVLARLYSVSREMILRRLLTLNKTNRSFYEAKRKEYLKEYERLELKARGKKQTGGIPPSVDLISTSGKPLVRLVLSAYSEKRIGLSDVAEILGIRTKHIGKVTSLAFASPV